MKTCYDCKETKPLDDFHKCVTRKDGRSALCKTCRSRLDALRVVVYRPKSKESMRKNALRQRGITPTEFDRLLEGQGGVCAICGESETAKSRWGTVKQLAVDHNHVTGTIRGLLCYTCNSGLGYFKDNPRLLEAAVQYLASEVGVL